MVLKRLKWWFPSISALAQSKNSPALQRSASAHPHYCPCRLNLDVFRFRSHSNGIENLNTYMYFEYLYLPVISSLDEIYCIHSFDWSSLHVYIDAIVSKTGGICFSFEYSWKGILHVFVFACLVNIKLTVWPHDRCNSVR